MSDEDGNGDGEVVSGPSIASMLEADGAPALRPDTVTLRVLRHLQRLDEGVVGIARTLDVPVAGRGGTRRAGRTADGGGRRLLTSGPHWSSPKY